MGKGKTGRKCFAALAAALFVAMAATARMEAVAAAPDILSVTEKESGRVWEEGQELDIFDSAYYGGKVIAPGSTGTYSFFVQNQTDLAAACQVSFAEQNPAGVPVRYRLLEDGAYLSGDDSTWVDISGLVAAARSLGPGEGIEYTLEWKWDTADDATDTLLGIAARDGLTYTLDISVAAEQEGGRDTPKTGDGPWSGLLVTTGIPAAISLSGIVWILGSAGFGHGKEDKRQGRKEMP